MRDFRIDSGQPEITFTIVEGVNDNPLVAIQGTDVLRGTTIKATPEQWLAMVEMVLFELSSRGIKARPDGWIGYGERPEPDYTDYCPVCQGEPE